MARYSGSSVFSGPSRSASSHGCSGVVSPKDARYLSIGSALDAAFPQRDHAPTFTSKCRRLLAVTFLIALQLRPPVPRIALGLGRLAMRAAVPETAVHENRELAIHKSDVGSARRLGIMQAISGEARSPKACTNDELRLGVLGPDPAHGQADVGVGRLGPSARHGPKVHCHGPTFAALQRPFVRT